MKQRVEAVPPQARLANGLGFPTLVGASADDGVVEVKPGEVTWFDRAKGYYHTLFAVLSGITLLVVEFGPDLGALPGLPDKWRHGIAIAVVFANMIATRLKSNEQWFPAPSSAA